MLQSIKLFNIMQLKDIYKKSTSARVDNANLLPYFQNFDLFNNNEGDIY